MHTRISNNLDDLTGFEEVVTAAHEWNLGVMMDVVRTQPYGVCGIGKLQSPDVVSAA